MSIRSEVKEMSCQLIRSEVKEMSCQSEVKEMSCQLEVKSKRCHVSCQCARNAVSHKNRNDAGESKMTHEMLCFTIEVDVGGREGRRCPTARRRLQLWSPMVGPVRHWEVQLQRVRRLAMGLPGGAGLRMVALCFWGRQLQIASRRVLVASR